MVDAALSGVPDTGSPQAGDARPEDAAPARSFAVIIAPHGWRFDAQPSVSLLASARNAGFTLPSSCRNGTCRTCLCRLVAGQVRYSIEWPGVSADEKLEGLILPCVATAVSDVVIEVPAAKDMRGTA